MLIKGHAESNEWLCTRRRPLWCCCTRCQVAGATHAGGACTSTPGMGPHKSTAACRPRARWGLPTGARACASRQACVSDGGWATTLGGQPFTEPHSGFTASLVPTLQEHKLAATKPASVDIMSGGAPCGSALLLCRTPKQRTAGGGTGRTRACAGSGPRNTATPSPRRATAPGCCRAARRASDAPGPGPGRTRPHTTAGASHTARLLRPRARQVSPSLHLLLSDKKAYHCTNDRCPTPTSRSCAVSLATGLDVAACVASPLRAWRAELRLTRARCRGTVQGLCALGNRGAGSGMCWHAPVSHARCPRRDDANDMLFRECLATHEVVLPQIGHAFGVVPHPCIAQSHNCSEGYYSALPRCRWFVVNPQLPLDPSDGGDQQLTACRPGSVVLVAQTSFRTPSSLGLIEHRSNRPWFWAARGHRKRLGAA